MAKLPDATDLGSLPSANSGRQIAQYDITGVARGAAAIAAGVSDLGKGIQTGARDFGYSIQRDQAQTDTLQNAKAESNYLIKTKNLDDQLGNETDPNDLRKRYEPQYKSALDESAALISNPQQRELWTLKRAPDVTGRVLAVDNHALKLNADNEVANATTQLETIRQAALKEPDQVKKDEIIRSGSSLIEGLHKANYISAVQAQGLTKRWQTNYAKGALELMPPEQRMNVLREQPQTKEAILDRIGGVESGGNANAKNPNSSASGLFQFTDGTWLDTIKAYRPDLATRDRQTLLDLRSDAKLSREMAGHLLDDNSAVLRSQGVVPDATNLYLAHFLGAGTAAKVANAPAGTPISDIVGKDAIDANQSVLKGKTTDSIVAWAAQKMGGGLAAGQQFSNYSLPGKEGALIEYHRDNLRNGTFLDNGGDISTVYITGVTGPDGKIYNVPGFWDGKLHTDVKEITDHAAASGWDKWPSYKNGKEADAAAERVHKIVEADTDQFRAPKSKGGGILDFIPVEDRPALIQQAREQVAATAIDNKTIIAQQKQQAQEASDKRELDVFKDIHSDAPQVSARAILDDPTLSKEAKEKLFKLKETATAGDKTEKTYGDGFYEAYRRIHLPDGDPERITDPGQLYTRVGPKGDLTVSGVDKLVSEIQGRKTPEGVAESEMKKQFLVAAKAQITGTDEGLHIRDPKGGQLYLKFLAQVLPAYDKARADGKPAAELLNPDSPAYIGKSIEGFKRPMNQWFSDVIQDTSAPAAKIGSAAFDVATVKSLDELVSAYRSGKVNKAIADQTALERGWAVRRPAVAVPISQ